MRPKRKRLRKGLRTIIRKNSYIIKHFGLPPVRPLEVFIIHGNLYTRAPDGEFILLDEFKDPSEQLEETINGYCKDWLEGIKDPIGPFKSYDGIVKEDEERIYGTY